MKNRFHVFGIAAIVLSSSGCANFDPTLGGIVKIETSPNSAVSTMGGSSGKRSMAATDSATNTHESRDLTGIKNKWDVDTLYARAMKNFAL